MIGSNTTTARLRLALEGQGEVVRGLSEVQAGVGSMRRAMASLAGGLSLGAAVTQLVDVQRQMDVLNASLITVTGSSAAADQNMAWIKRFAAQTPYQLNEVTGAFVKMKALGLDASEQALRSYGNTASAMGKDLNQFIEAVADAATGEFERLKEFGIKASKQGDDVRFTFRGVTTTVKNSSDQIVQYLQRIGNTDFAGAMDRRVTTLDGAISNLSDTWDELFRTVNEAGVGRLIETTVRGATTAIAGLGDTIRNNKAELAILGGTLAGTALAATLPRVASGFLLVAGGVRALGLALAANPLTLALLGIGAGAGALIGFNAAKNSTVEGIKKQIQLIEQAEAVSRRSNLDAATAEALRIKRNEQLLALRQKLKELEGPPEGAVPSGDVALRRAQAAGSAAAAGAADGLNPKSPKGKKVKDALDELHMYSAETQAKFQQILIDKAADWQAEALQQELASNQVESFFRQAEIEAESRWQAQQEKADQAARDAADKLRQAEVAEWEKVNDQITQSLTDSLFDGGKSFLDNLASYARTVVLRPIIAPIGAALGGLLGGPASAGSGSGSAAASLGDAGSLLGNVAGIGALAGAFGTGMAASFSSAMAAGVSGWATAAGSLIGTGTASGIAAGLGMIAAPLAAVALAWKPLFGRELKGQGIVGDFRDGAFTGQSYKYYEGGVFRDDKTTYDAIDPALQKSLSDRYAAITNSTVAAANALGLDGQRARNTYATGLSYDFAGKSQDEIDAWFNQMFQGIADYQATQFDGLQALVREGETASGTLQALATSLTGVNAIFDTLGTTAYQASLAGGDAARSLADLFGGLEAFNTSASAYYQAYYSQGERTATATRQLTASLGALGLQLPASRDGFRALVEAQDLTTESGRSTYAALLRLSPAFAELTESIEQAGSAIADEITRLRGLATGSTTAQGYASLQARFATTTAQARAGDAAALQALPDISKALDEAATLQASTAAELNLIRQQLAASLQATLAGRGLQVPSLDVGTNYVPHDMLLMAHRGEAVVPAAYNPAAGGAAPANADTAAELRALRDLMSQILQGQGAGFSAVATHTAKTARILERATPTGEALLMMTQADLDAP